MEQGRPVARIELFEGYIQNRVFLPILVIEVPPFGFIDSEAFRLHGAAKEVAMPSLKRSAAGIIEKRARRHFIIGARHFDGFSSRQVVKREIDGTATVVARALSGIGDENLAFGRGGIPED